MDRRAESLSAGKIIPSRYTQRTLCQVRLDRRVQGVSRPVFYPYGIHITGVWISEDLLQLSKLTSFNVLVGLIEYLDWSERAKSNRLS